jgi:hypothetical protein
MLTAEIRNQVDQIWNAFWSGGVSNPLSVIEQITYLLFIKRVDDRHAREEHKAAMLGLELARRIFPEGSDPKVPPARAGPHPLRPARTRRRLWLAGRRDPVAAWAIAFPLSSV